LQILYADSFKLTSGNHLIHDSHLMACVDYCRSLPGFSRVPLLFFPENAPGNVGEQILELFLRVERMQPGRVKPYFITRDSGSAAALARGEGRLGITPSNQLKEDMTTRFIRLVRDKCLVFSAHFAAGPGDDASRFDTLTATRRMREKVCRQMACWELISEASRTGRVSVHWTGKRVGRDDVVVAVLYSIYFGIDFIVSDRPEYAAFKAAIGNPPLPTL
jgi:hypothetical protein